MRFETYPVSKMLTNDPTIINICKELAEAVEISLNPDVPQQKRIEAYTACENFKETSPLCVQCSLYLSANGSHLVRHFGLQLMEYCVKYKWYEISQQDKLTIKDMSMRLLENGDSIIATYAHLKDGLSRVFVEMIKREWPQNWPTLFPELFKIAFKGFTQAELVLYIFLRLIEDVAVLQNLESTQRKKDIHQSLIIYLDDVITFIISIMERHYQFCQTSASVDGIVVRLALDTLSKFLEWAPIVRILADNGKVLHVLSVLILNQNFNIDASECFLQILSRKGKPDEMSLIVTCFFNTDITEKFVQFDCLLRENRLIDNNGLNDNYYGFVKKIAEILSNLCALLCGLSDKLDNNPSATIERLLNFEKFEICLKLMLTLCNHNSYSVVYIAVSGWNFLFKNKIFNQSNSVMKFLPEWINIVATKLLKIDYLKGNELEETRLTWRYLQLDFDSEDSYITFFHQYRTELIGSFKNITSIVPELIFSCLEQWLMSNIRMISSRIDYLVQSKEYLHWEAQIALMFAVTGAFPTNYQVPLDNCLRLIDLCLNLKSIDPNIISFSLSAVSYSLLCIKNSQSTEILPRVVEKIFSVIYYEKPDETKLTRSKSVRNLRRHAGCLLLKLSLNLPHMLLPFFENILDLFQQIKHDVNNFSKLEIYTILEALIALSNNFFDFQKQQQIIKPILSEIEFYWTQICVPTFEDLEKFMNFIGLISPGADDVIISGENRTKLMMCIETIMVIISRTYWPDNKDVAVNGGFVIGYSSSGNPIYCNPAAESLLPFLPGVFLLIKILNTLTTDGAKSKLPDGLKSIYEISELECKLIIGCGGLDKTDIWSSLESTNQQISFLAMQSYYITLHENSLTILSKCCSNISYQFYRLPNFAPSFIISIFSHIDSLPDYRLRIVLKLFIRNFVIFCPSENFDSVLIPILEYLSNHMLERLCYRWRYLADCREKGMLNSNDGDEDCNSKETLENLIITQLTREYIDIIRLILFLQPNDPKQQSSANEIEENSGSQSNLNQIKTTKLSELGLKILSAEKISNAIVLTILQAISWNDSLSSYKAVTYMLTVLKQLLSTNQVTPDLATQFMISLLQGLQIHGEHDGNVGGLLNTAVCCYEILRPNFVQILDVMKMIPNINLDELKKFDDRILNRQHDVKNYNNKVDKGQREKFRKLINLLIGKNISQLFKRKEKIRELPPITVFREKGDDLIAKSNNAIDVGIANFFK